jgi:hypothetical protein|tara:strand:- start:1804 stop:2031 length:228 start_codon:yes stop_codon:yes gene_type:complete
MNNLMKLKDRGWWVQVQPLSSKRKWICGIYKEGKNYWVTEMVKSNFSDPHEAYMWAFEQIDKQDRTSGDYKTGTL